MRASKGDTNKNRKQPIKDWLKSLGVTGATIFAEGSDFIIRLKSGEKHVAKRDSSGKITCDTLQGRHQTA